MTIIIGIGKRTTITDILATKILFHIDEHGKLHKTASFEDLIQYDKLRIKKQNQIKLWIRNINDHNVTLPIKYFYPSQLTSKQLFINNEIINQVYNILKPFFRLARLFDIVPDNGLLPKSKIIYLCAKVFQNDISCVDNFKIIEKKLYKNEMIKSIISEIYEAVLQFIRSKNDPELLLLFGRLYPDRYKPRCTWINMYEVFIEY